MESINCLFLYSFILSNIIFIQLKGVRLLKIIIMIIFIVFLCVSCIDVNNDNIEKIINEPYGEIIYELETNNYDRLIYKINYNTIDDNDNQIATDGRYIYYIDLSTRYINKIKPNGSDNQLVSEHKCSKLIYYKEKIYFIEYTKESSWLSCINKDGSNYQVVCNYSKLIDDFVIYDDIVYMLIFIEEQDPGYMFGFYKYDLKDGKIETFDDDLTLPNFLGLHLINEKVYYSVNYKTKIYDIKTDMIKEYDKILYRLQEINGCFYSHSEHHILKSDTNDISNFTSIYEINDDYIIRRISVTDDLIFFTYSYDYTESNEQVFFVDVINRNGGNNKNLYNYKYSDYGHLPFDVIYVINDTLIIISRDTKYPLFAAIDFEGNELWSLY